MTAKRAPVGLKEPLESRLHGISGAYASKVDGSAMWDSVWSRALHARGSWLYVRFRRAACGRTGAIRRRRGVIWAGVSPTAGHSAARFARRRQLFRRSQVGLRQLAPFVRARNLPFVSF